MAAELVYKRRRRLAPARAKRLLIISTEQAEPMTKRRTITQAFLRSILEYNPKTGLWKWREQKGRRAKGWFLGSTDGQGYPTIGIRFNGQDRVYKAHRLAYFYMKGRWPRKLLDHRNQIKKDNRWLNLRDASRSQNGMNRRKWKNASGYKGVYYHPWETKTRQWRAGIRVKRKMIWLGMFPSAAVAAKAYRNAAIRYHGEFACLN